MPDEATWSGFFDPPAVLARLEQPTNGDVVEFGCGYGTFTLPCARHTTGIVHALDIEPDMVAAVAAGARRDGLANVRTEVRDFMRDGSGLRCASVTLVLAFNILHIEAPERLLATAHAALAPGGHLAVIHWRSDIDTPRGPPLAIRPRPRDIIGWAAACGFGQARVVELGAAAPWHFGLILEPTSAPASCRG